MPCKHIWHNLCCSGYILTDLPACTSSVACHVSWSERTAAFVCWPQSEAWARLCVAIFLFFYFTLAWESLTLVHLSVRSVRFVCTSIIFLSRCDKAGNVAVHERRIISLLWAHSFHHVTIFIYWNCNTRFFSVTNHQVLHGALPHLNLNKKQKLNYIPPKKVGVLLLFTNKFVLDSSQVGHPRLSFTLG